MANYTERFAFTRYEFQTSSIIEFAYQINEAISQLPHTHETFERLCNMRLNCQSWRSIIAISLQSFQVFLPLILLRHGFTSFCHMMYEICFFLILSLFTDLLVCSACSFILKSGAFITIMYQN